MLAAGLALERGWAINMGGGMHHAHASDGMGWCPFDDIMLAIRRLRKASGGQINRVLVIDLDAHQVRFQQQHAHEHGNMRCMHRIVEQ